MGAAAFQDVEEAHDVGVDVGVRIFEAVAHPRLGGEIDHMARLRLGEDGGHAVTVGQVELQVAIAGVALQDREPRGLQLGIVVGIEAVEAHDLVAALEQPAAEVEADEAGRAGDQNRQDVASELRGAQRWA